MANVLRDALKLKGLDFNVPFVFLGDNAHDIKYNGR